MRSPRTLATASLLAITVLLAGCGGSSSDAAPAASGGAAGVTTTSTTSPRAEAPAEPVAVAPTEAPTALVARSAGELAVYAAPGDSEPSQILAATTDFGSARALLVEREQGEWLEVLLPTRPNGSTGWVRRDHVELRAVEQAIVVDLTARTLTYTMGGEPVFVTPIAVGTADSPTPTGRFYVVDKLDTQNDDSPYGPFAFGLSGHSDVITDFAGGDGQIGIHGTDDPSSIGTAASHGCVRVPNEVAVQLNDLLPLGTPVTIL